jgi:hypothetical protein
VLVVASTTPTVPKRRAPCPRRPASHRADDSPV